MAASARVRKYVKDNFEVVEGWKVKVLRHHLVRRILEDQKISDQGYYVSPYSLTGNRGQDNICCDVMEEHYDLTRTTTHKNKWGELSKEVYVVESTFEEMVKDLGEAPVFDIRGTYSDVGYRWEQRKKRKTRECEIYAPLRELPLLPLAYIYHNQDLFRFMMITDEDGNEQGYGVLYKEEAAQADSLSFRNAIDAHFKGKIALVAKVVFGKDLPRLINPEKLDGSEVEASWNCNRLISELTPQDGTQLTLAELEEKIIGAESAAKKTRELADQLTSLRDSIVEAGGDKEFLELYYKKMIDSFYTQLPLYINDNGQEVRDLVKRASKKDYRQ